MLPGEITELLYRQVDMLRKTLSDLEAVQQDLPSHRQHELACIMGRLSAALVDDCDALTRLGETPVTAASQEADPSAAARSEDCTAKAEADARRDRRLGEMLVSRPAKLPTLD